MTTIILAIIIFGLLIFVHELGHFLAARAFDVKVIEFALGMGPAIWKRQKGETLYSLRLIPIGGFCKMEGEDEEQKSSRSFGAKPWWARLVILYAGSIMNLLLGFLLCLVIAIVVVEGFNPLAVLQNTTARVGGLIQLMVQSVAMLFTGEVGVGDFSGPVGIVQVIGEVAQVGMPNLILLTAFLTINIGIFNLLPLPALDGGRSIFVIIEAIRKKPLNPEKEATVHFVGIVLLFGLMLFVTFNDIVRIFN